MTAMLRHKPTGDLYIRTALLALRDDMEVVEEVVGEVVEEAAAEPAKPARGKRKAVDAAAAALDADSAD